MEEHQTRSLHRITGPILFIFIIVQVITGLVISADQLKEPHSHAIENYQTIEETEKHSGTGHVHLHLGENVFSQIHYGGGMVGSVYRVALAIGIIFQAVTGVMIFLKIRSRMAGKKD